MAGRRGYQARHACASHGPGLDLSSGHSRPDRRLVFAPLCSTPGRQFSDRERNGTELNPPRHPAGVALSSSELTDFRSGAATLRRHRLVLAIAALVGLVAGIAD